MVVQGRGIYININIQSNLSIATIEGNSEKGHIRQGVFIEVMIFAPKILKEKP
jgi:hypothetical protein